MSNTTVQAQIDSNSNRNKALSAFARFEDRRNSDDGSQVNHDLDNNEIIEIQEEENKLDLTITLPLYQSGSKTEKVVIVQRDQRPFWQILFRQKFDLSKVSLKVCSAGEAAEDLQDPFVNSYLEDPFVNS